MFGNISKNYTSPKINLFEEAKKQNNAPVLFKNNNNSKNNSSAITVSISKESLEALHGSNLSGSVDLNKQLNDRKYIFEHQPTETYENHFAKALSNLNSSSSKTTPTLQEKADFLLNEYKNLYNEISKGYKDKTRVRFIADESSNDGYKKLTKEEELSILQNEFEIFINNRFGKQHQENNIKFAKIINDIQSTKSRLTNTPYSQYEPETIPNNFAEKIIASAREYAKNYEL